MKKNFTIKTRRIKRTIISMAMTAVMGAGLLTQTQATAIVAKADCPTYGAWTDEVPTTCSQQYQTRTVYRSKNVRYTSSATDAAMTGWTLYNTDSKVVGKGDKIEYGKGNNPTAPAKSGAYRVWAEKINYTYNPDIYTRPTIDISVVTSKTNSHSSMKKWIQLSLCRYGYNAPVDGVYGSATFAYVKQFQKDNNITATGIFGKATLQKMTYKIDNDPKYCYYYQLDAKWSAWSEESIAGDTILNPGVTNVLVESKQQYCYVAPEEELETPVIKKINFKAKLTKVKMVEDPDADGYECTVVKVSIKSLKKFKKEVKKGGEEPVSIKGIKTFTSKTANISLKNLKKGKRYAMAVRSFKLVDGEKVYSEYSSIKLFKVKK